MYFSRCPITWLECFSSLPMKERGIKYRSTCCETSKKKDISIPVGSSSTYCQEKNSVGSPPGLGVGDGLGGRSGGLSGSAGAGPSTVGSAADATWRISVSSWRLAVCKAVTGGVPAA